MGEASAAGGFPQPEWDKKITNIITITGKDKKKHHTQINAVSFKESYKRGLSAARTKLHGRCPRMRTSIPPGSP